MNSTRRWWLADMCTVLVQLIFLAIMSFLPLAWSVLHSLNRVPYHGVSPMTSLTVDHFGSRGAEFTAVLLETYPQAALFTLVAFFVFAVSLLHAYVAETLPLSLSRNCARVLHVLETPASEVSSCSRMQYVAAVWSGGMKIIPWTLSLMNTVMPIFHLFLLLTSPL